VRPPADNKDHIKFTDNKQKLCYETAGLKSDISTYERRETRNILQRINFLLRILFIRNIPKERNIDVSRQGRSDVHLSVTKFNPCGVKL
jgi:hypothetical protein